MIFWYIFMSGAPNSCWESHIKPNTLHKVARANILSQCYSPAEIWLGSPGAFGDPHRDSVGKRIWIPSVYDILVQIYDWLPYRYILWLKVLRCTLEGEQRRYRRYLAVVPLKVEILLFFWQCKVQEPTSCLYAEIWMGDHLGSTNGS